LFLFVVLVLALLWRFFPRRRVAETVPSASRRFSERALASSYDYVVVGSGPAACALVARLAAKTLPSGSAPSIIVIEAGSDLRHHDDGERGKRKKKKKKKKSLRFPQARVPNRWLSVTNGYNEFQQHELDWGYDVYLAKHNRWDGYARGKTLGGSGAVNAMMWVLGDPKDWDTIGHELWSWKAHIGPLFQWLNSKFDTRLVSQGNRTFKEMMQSFKLLNPVEDHQQAILDNSVPAPISVSRQMNTLSARLNPFSVLVEPLLLAGNVTVVDSALVERIVIEQGAARGVVFSVVGAGARYVGAKREVFKKEGI
jgi:choline dehydrogenase